MHPSAPFPPLADIGLHPTEEELVMCLEQMVHGTPPPRNVLTDVNPFDFLPENLPDNMWYFFNSEDPKDTGTGYWKSNGENHKIVASSCTTGWRTTHEFYEGRAPHGNKTHWMMLEYRVNQVSNSLCRVFLNSGRSPNHREQHKQAAAAADADEIDIHLILQIMVNAEENDRNAQDSTSRAQVVSQTMLNAEENNRNAQDSTSRAQGMPLLLSERQLLDQTLDQPIEGDFLELLDLYDLGSSSSCSEVSSCLSGSSDEYFDPSTLLQDLEAGNDRNMQQKHTDSKFSVSASPLPNQVIMRPASSGSLLRSNGSKLPSKATIKSDPSLTSSAVRKQLPDCKDAKHAAAVQKISNVNKGSSSCSINVPASSNGLRATVKREKKTVVGRMTKLRKKYFCFMPF